jgi:hypothetical protein
MPPDPLRTLLFGITGITYGGLLFFPGFIATGAGHGTYVVAALASAPLSLAQDIGLALFAPPFVWGAVGILLAGVDRPVRRTLFLAAMFAHYASLAFVLRGQSKFADWEYVDRVGGLAAVAFAIYAAGQVILWGTFFALSRATAERGGRKR